MNTDAPRRRRTTESGARPPAPPVGRVLAQPQKYYDVDLTYTFNAIEGNTLTLCETADVIEHGVTVRSVLGLRSALPADRHSPLRRRQRTHCAAVDESHAHPLRQSARSDASKIAKPISTASNALRSRPIFLLTSPSCVSVRTRPCETIWSPCERRCPMPVRSAARRPDRTRCEWTLSMSGRALSDR